jgi:hypothetical protein
MSRKVDRRDELHALDRHRRDRALGTTRRGDAARDIHLAKYPAAEDMAVGVDVAWAGHDAQDRFASWSVNGLILFESAGFLVVTAARLRKARLINAPRASTERPAPSAVAIIMWICGPVPRATSSTAMRRDDREQRHPAS